MKRAVSKDFVDSQLSNSQRLHFLEILSLLQVIAVNKSSIINRPAPNNDS